MSYETCEAQLAKQLNNVSGLSSVDSAAFTGSGLNDLTSGGTFTGTTETAFKVQIDGTGTPDTFKWSNDDGTTWEATTVAITGSAQTLENGVTITFGATTGHTLTNAWTFLARTSVAFGDWLVFNRGPGKAAILEYDRMTQTVTAFAGQHSINWQVNIILAVKYQTDAQATNDMRDLRQAVIDRVNQYPHLGDSTIVWDAFIESGDSGNFNARIEQVKYMLEMLACRITEDFEVTYQE